MATSLANEVLSMITEWTEQQKKEKKPMKSFGSGVFGYTKETMPEQLRTILDKFVGSNV